MLLCPFFWAHSSAVRPYESLSWILAPSSSSDVTVSALPSVHANINGVDLNIQLSKYNKLAVFLQLLLHLFQPGSGQYKRYMVHPVLRECINNAENVVVFGF